MPWIEPTDPYAKPPRVRAVVAGEPWRGQLDLDRGAAELAAIELTNDNVPDLTGCTELTIRDSALSAVTFQPAGEISVELYESVLVGCDLSPLAVPTLRSSRVDGCKFIGTDFGGGTITDVVFERCVFRYANWRMARLKRVQFVDCTIDDVDAFEAVFEDIGFPGTTLLALNVDRLQATRVDLRGAREIGLSGVGSLVGWLLAEYQLPALAPVLALAVGVDIEKPSTDTEA